MAEDLDAFFAKKKQKKGKKNVQDVNVLGAKLEKTVRRQEVYDKEEEEERERQRREQENQQLEVNEAESEWYGYDVQKEVDVQAAGVKALEVGEEEPELVPQEELEKHPQKTWNLETTTAPEQAQEQEPPQTEPHTTTPSRYVPPSMRRQQQSTGRTPNVNDAEQFPSLGDAAAIEKEAEDRKKKEEARKLQDASSGRPMAPPPPGENDEFTEVRYQRGPPAAAPQEAPAHYQPRAGSYVPPHLRSRNQEPPTANRFESFKD